MNDRLIVTQGYLKSEITSATYVTIILVNCRDDKLKRCCVDCHKSILNVHGDELSNIIKLFGAYNWRWQFMLHKSFVKSVRVDINLYTNMFNLTAPIIEKSSHIKHKNHIKISLFKSISEDKIIIVSTYFDGYYFAMRKFKFPQIVFTFINVYVCRLGVPYHIQNVCVRNVTFTCWNEYHFQTIIRFRRIMLPPVYWTSLQIKHRYVNRFNYNVSPCLLDNSSD
jgi:hypothetical protein